VQGPRRLPLVFRPAHVRDDFDGLDHLLPEVPCRQWVLSFDSSLAARLGYDARALRKPDDWNKARHPASSARPVVRCGAGAAAWRKSCA
jgi:hypothetical protein